MSKTRVVNAKKPISVTVGMTETGKPTMTVGNSDLVFTGVKGKGKNRALVFSSLRTMRTPKGVA